MELCFWFCTIQPIPHCSTDTFLYWWLTGLIGALFPLETVMGSLFLLEKPKFLGVADPAWSSSCLLFNLPASSQSILPYSILCMKYTGHREPPEVWAIWHAVSCLHHFGAFCFPAWSGLFPCFHISSQCTQPIISCCKWCSSQSPELITDSVVEPLCLVHVPYLSQ